MHQARADVPGWPAVDVWKIDLTGACTAPELAVLSREERDRADRFVHPKHHRRFVRRRAALRGILARYTGAAPEQVVFEHQYNGKPVLGASPTLHFNCSDTCDIALVAVAKEVIGIDIEQVRLVRDMAGLIKTVCTDREARPLERLNPDTQTQAFFRIWAAKEALIKLTGEGLSAALKSIETNLSSCPIVADQSGTNRSLTELEVGPEYRAMLATADTENRPDIRHFQWA